MIYDTIIVGAGIAGISAALALGREENVLVVEARTPAAGASGVAGGLFSPMLALRGRPIWRIQEAIDAFYRQLDDTNGQAFYDNRGVIRPAHDEQQAIYFKESVAFLPDEAEWLSAEESQERFPLVHAPYGSMFVHRAGAVNLADYVNYLAQAARQQGVDIRTHTRVTEFGDAQNGAYLNVETGDGLTERLETKRVILCWGRTFLETPALDHLHLHLVKGQTIRITLPKGIAHQDLIPTSGKGYIIPQPDHIAVGSSFEHTYTSEAASQDVSIELLQKACTMVPALHESTVIDAQIGFRVTVPGYRMPIVGQIPGYERVYAFSAFGSKGLLLAPLLAYELPGYLSNTLKIPSELQLRVKT